MHKPNLELWWGGKVTRLHILTHFCGNPGGFQIFV